jgi:hypothetical protein
MVGAERGKIFAVGLSRTGTYSLNEALRLLGHRSVHFPDDAATQAEITNFLARRPAELRLSLLASVDALTDTPVSATYQALDRAYPGSRFILTVREKESWLEACSRYWHGPLLQYLDGPTGAYIRRINAAVYGAEHYDRIRFSSVYDAHITGVLDYFSARPDDLLVMRICDGDGWEPLCRFLATAPPRSAFPQLNTHAVVSRQNIHTG